MSFKSNKILTPRINVHIPKNVEHQIRYLCKEISNIEWSGPLFYTIEGSISNPTECKIQLQEIMPLDKGSAGATNYDVGLPVAKFMHKHGAMDKNWKIGHIHSHHNMDVFFSATDQSEIEENSSRHNFYLSVIVNNNNKIIAKVGITANPNIPEGEQVGFSAMDEQGNPYIIQKFESVEESKYFEYECNVILEQEELQVSDDFKDLIDNMTTHRLSSRDNLEGKKSTVKKSYPGSYGLWGDDEDEEDYPSSSKNAYGNTSYNSFNKSTYSTVPSIEDEIEEFSFSLLAADNVSDDEILAYTTVEDLVEYYIATEASGVEIALRMLKNYETVYDATFSNSKARPSLYILRKVIQTYKNSLTSKKGNKELLLPIIDKLQEKYEELLKPTK